MTWKASKYRIPKESKVEVNLPIMLKRLTVSGSTLRISNDEKTHCR